MGFAIAGTHHTSMAASSFPQSDQPVDYSRGGAVSSLGVAGIVIVTFLLLGFAAFTSVADQRLTAQRQLAEDLYRGRCCNAFWATFLSVLLRQTKRRRYGMTLKIFEFVLPFDFLRLSGTTEPRDVESQAAPPRFVHLIFPK
jgi:Bacterial signalling protein N terminal repeat